MIALRKRRPVCVCSAAAAYHHPPAPVGYKRVGLSENVSLIPYGGMFMHARLHGSARADVPTISARLDAVSGAWRA